MDNPMKDVEYLGDGLYAMHDGYQFWLYANSHEYPTDRVALEPEVFRAFVAYGERIIERAQSENQYKEYNA